MMGIKARVGISAGLVALVWGGSLQAQQTPDVVDVARCELKIGVEQIPIQDEPISVSVQTSEPLGEEVAAALPEESKVRVLGVARNDDDEPETIRIMLNTSAAVAGAWPVTIRAGETECRGTIRVAGEPDGR